MLWLSECGISVYFFLEENGISDMYLQFVLLAIKMLERYFYYSSFE